MENMITINHCLHCGSNFMIPAEWTDGLDITFFVCPECSSRNWIKLSDSSLCPDEQLISEHQFKS